MAFNNHIHNLKMKVFSVLPFFLGPIFIWGDINLISTAHRAENLFGEKLYTDALPLFSQLYDFTAEPDLKAQWGLRKVACHLEEGQPQTALAVLSSLDPSFYRNHSLILMSAACRQMGHSRQALQILQQCSHPLSHNAKDLIAIEQSFHLMQLNDFKTAKQVLKTILRNSNQPLAYEIAQIQLAKIFIMERQFEEAYQILNTFSPSLTSPSIIRLEGTYLRGCALLALKKEAQAAECWEELLPNALSASDKSTLQVLRGLIISYLRQALTLDPSNQSQLIPLLTKAEDLLKTLLVYAPSESSYLLLSDFYLIQAKCRSDALSYAHAQHLLDKSELFSSPEGIRQARLKRAAAAPSYEERTQLYEKLTELKDQPSDFYSQIWFFKGINDFEEGMRCQKLSASAQNIQPFTKAVQAFHQVLQHHKVEASIQTARTLKYLLIAYAQLPAKFSTQPALNILNQFLNTPSLYTSFESHEEISCLVAWAALRLNNPEGLTKVLFWLQNPPFDLKMNSFWQERNLKLQGMICLQLEAWAQADKIFEKMLQNDAFTDSFGEAYFWRAYCAEKQGADSALPKEYFEKAYTDYPQSAYAPLAYFHLYSYRDYMQGHRKAIKHLQALPLLFPHHPIAINASYLIGLYHKKDHLSEGGQLVRHKDGIAAIDAFQMAESTFDMLIEKKLIPKAQLNYYMLIRTQAQLEKALANLAIAQLASVGKRQIYLKYAEEVFKQLIHDFTDPESLTHQLLVQSDTSYPKLWAEAELHLAKVYTHMNRMEDAEKILEGSIEHYQKAQQQQGSGLRQVWYAKGSVAQLNQQYEKAIQYFLEAEKSARDSLDLPTHEKLDLWIQLSLCYKSLHQFDQSMLLLSRVINEDAISALRIKAMFLRAEVYELQGRPELAIKQLEAAARKGGEWSQQAKEKLEKVYGYQFSSPSSNR